MGNKVMDWKKTKPTCYIDARSDNIESNPKHEHFIVKTKGDCIDSDLSPIRIKDGDCLMLHEEPIIENTFLVNMKKIIAIQLNDICLTKQLVFYDGVSNIIHVKYYKPNETVLKIPINEIKALFVVDKVFSKEYVELNKV